MNTDIFMLTLRMLLGRRRTIFLGLVALLPLLVAFAFRTGGGDQTDPLDWTANALLGGMITGIFLPLAALVFGTAAFGAESEDGTLVYILARPIPRVSVIAAKLAAAVIATGVLVLPAALLAGIIAVGGEDGGASLITGFVVGLAGGIVVYSALFLCLGVVTSRAFIIGLVYVFVWEGVITNIFQGTRNLSIRSYTLGLADGVANVRDSAFEADIGMLTAIVMMAIVTGLTLFLAVRGAERYQFGESG
jgi:ABC-2 type transport system permease protein